MRARLGPVAVVEAAVEAEAAEVVAAGETGETGEAGEAVEDPRAALRMVIVARGDLEELVKRQFQSLEGEPVHRAEDDFEIWVKDSGPPRINKLDGVEGEDEKTNTKQEVPMPLHWVIQEDVRVLQSE